MFPKHFNVFLVLPNAQIKSEQRFDLRLVKREYERYKKLLETACHYANFCNFKLIKLVSLFKVRC